MPKAANKGSEPTLTLGALQANVSFSGCLRKCAQIKYVSDGSRNKTSNEVNDTPAEAGGIIWRNVIPGTA